MRAIVLASNPNFYARTKHMEVDYYSFREKVVNKDFAIHYIAITSMCRCVYKRFDCLSISSGTN